MKLFARQPMLYRVIPLLNKILLLLKIQLNIHSGETTPSATMLILIYIPLTHSVGTSQIRILVGRIAAFAD